MSTYSMDIGDEIGGVKSGKIGMENAMDSTAKFNTDLNPAAADGGFDLLKPFSGGDNPTFAGGYTPSKPDSSIFGNGMGSTMMGIGSIASAAAGMYNAYNQKKYQDKLFKMEETRVKRETARQDEQQKNYEKVFG